MDNIKEAFLKVKQDIDSLKEEIGFIKKSLVETRQKMVELTEIMGKIVVKTASTHKPEKQTASTHTSTHESSFKPPKPQNLHISTGNEGVSTDRQTDRQTHQQTHFSQKNTSKSIEDAVEILDSLDNIKKEIRNKFKRLTDQEILVFSTMYQLDEEKGFSNHKMLSQRLGLSESSIRDYVGRLIKKGIPVVKKKLNNKTLQLFISPNLKKIASLSTILQLRDL